MISNFLVWYPHPTFIMTDHYMLDHPLFNAQVELNNTELILVRISNRPNQGLLAIFHSSDILNVPTVLTDL